ncbi:MAG: tRNA (adenosine(37)-N6)-threonylcarbamoyltransferase complex ATPase subunit type 1 TsaE [Candidatus Buchananbacteria bacterium]|jgi:tRNA threonylcarbamoyladenosine biosynthesis protein TsaE
MQKITSSEQKTFEFAKTFAKRLKGGEVLCLIGDLGAGKTAFTKGLASGLDVKNIITSPTFVLMKVYSVHHDAIKKLAHIDAYRINSGEDLEAIGIDDYFNDKNCVTVIEWADRVKEIWPKNVTKINFKILEGDKRKVTVT